MRLGGVDEHFELPTCYILLSIPCFWGDSRHTQNTVWRLPLFSVVACRVPSRRLDDHIRDLCAKALTAPDSELDAIFSELNGALHGHNERLRKLAAEKLASRQKEDLPERRSR